MNAPFTTLPERAPRSSAHLPKTVLVVDDFPIICELVARHLSTLGLRVLIASNLAEVDRILLSEAGEKIDLLLTDVEMPEMRGDQLAAWFSQVRPEARVLFMTGNPAGVPEPRIAAVLEKPFSLVELNTAVRRALGCEAPETARSATAA